ncbi:MAG: exosortase-associated protein EpsI, V-type [Chakrabartia sp.]
MDRRAFLIGGACLASAAGATALRPRERVSLMGNLKLEDAIPRQFAGWSRYDSNQIVTPESEDSLSRQLYSQSVARLYVRDDDRFVMMLIAYGDTQSDTLQLHRPEVCYPAFGMEIVANRPARIALAPHVAIPGRDLVARSAERQEFVTYWTRIGEALPASGAAQRSAKLRDAFAGRIPDGVLARFSTLGAAAGPAFETNRAFIADLMAALHPAARRALAGDGIMAALGRATLHGG